MASVSGGGAASPMAIGSRAKSDRNSSWLKSVRTASGSHGPWRSSVGANSSSTSRRSHVIVRLRRTRSLCSPRFCRCLGGSSSRCSKTESRSPYFTMREAAVFSPMPGTPGRLSLLSPRRAAYCGILAGGDSQVALGDPRFVVEDVVGHPAAVVQHLDVRILDQLEGVPVAGDDDHVHPLGGACGGQGGDHVVGLDALDAQLRHLHGLQHLPDERHLGGEQVRGLLAARLVLRVEVVAERAGRRVEGHRQVLGLLVGEQFHEHRREPEHRVGHRAGLGGQVGGEGVEGPVGQGVAVEEDERRHSRHRR